MRNLLHVPEEKLENLPSRQKRREVLTSKYNIHKEYNAKSFRNIASNILYRKIIIIIHASVGKKWNDIYSKLCKMCKNLSYDFNIADTVEYYIAFPTWSLRNQRWEFKSGRWGTNVDLLDRIDLYKNMYSNYTKSFYYVCPISNILRLVKSKVWSQEKDSNFWRRHYNFQKDRRRSGKKWRKEAKRDGEFLLSMINKPDLFRFYSRIKGEYKSHIKQIESDKNYYEKYSKSPNHKDRQWVGLYKPNRERINKVESLKDQIEELEKGNFNVFFESAVYLYAQQKECHHFETP